MNSWPSSTSDPQLLGFWIVINIINGIAREALHVGLPQQVWSLRSKRYERGAPSKLAHAECFKVCTIGERVWLLKG